MCVKSNISHFLFKLMWNHCFCVFSLLKFKFQFAYSKCWAWPTWILVPMKKKIKLKCRVVCVCVSVFDVIRIIRLTSISSLADYLSKSVICLFWIQFKFCWGLTKISFFRSSAKRSEKQNLISNVKKCPIEIVCVFFVVSIAKFRHWKDVEIV